MNPLQIILGLALALFIPGYLIAKIWFKELSELEKVSLGFVFSISIDIFLGLILGYNESMKIRTGGITAFNIWFYLGTITVLLLAYYIYKMDLHALPMPQISAVRYYEKASRFRDPEIFFLFFLLCMLIAQLVFKFQYDVAALLIMVFLLLLMTALSYIYNKQYRHIFASFSLLPTFKLLEIANPLNLVGEAARIFVYATILVILVIHIRISGRRTWKFGFKRFSLPQLLLALFAGGVLGFLTYKVIPQASTIADLPYMLSILLLFVFVEELLFRGVIVTFLAERVGNINAILFSSLAYISILFNGNAYMLAIYFVINVILSYIYTKLENVYITTIIHYLISVLAFILLPMYL